MMTRRETMCFVVERMLRCCCCLAKVNIWGLLWVYFTNYNYFDIRLPLSALMLRHYFMFTFVPFSSTERSNKIIYSWNWYHFMKCTMKQFLFETCLTKTSFTWSEKKPTFIFCIIGNFHTSITWFPQEIQLNWHNKNKQLANAPITNL